MLLINSHKLLRIFFVFSRSQHHMLCPFASTSQKIQNKRSQVAFHQYISRKHHNHTYIYFFILSINIDSADCSFTENCFRMVPPRPSRGHFRHEQRTLLPQYSTRQPATRTSPSRATPFSLYLTSISLHLLTNNNSSQLRFSC